MNGYIPLQDRLNVAELGLLESHLGCFNRHFVESESVDEDVLRRSLKSHLISKDALAIFKYVAGLSFDREAISRWLGEIWVKTKKGLTFYQYVQAVHLLWNNLFCVVSLIDQSSSSKMHFETTRCAHAKVRSSCRLLTAPYSF